MLLKRISAIVLVLALSSNCLSTGDPVEPEVVFDEYKGCEGFTGGSRYRCIQDMIIQLQTIKNAKKTEEEINRKRYNDKWVTVTYLICYSKHFCRKEPRYEYDPTFGYLLYIHGGPVAMALLAGAAAANSR